MRDDVFRGTGWAVLASAAALLLWDASGLDLLLAQAFGGAQGFALRNNFLLVSVLHDGTKLLAWLLVLYLCLGLAWPVAPMAALPFARRLQLVVTPLLAWSCVALLKTSSHTSCPWDLHDFGGLARYVSHWQGWSQSDGGGGHCFPAGHATTGFAFLGGYFALRGQRPRLARRWLWISATAGLVLGFAQQLRGAHFMSHTLWTGWICWMAARVSDPLFAGVDAAAVPEASS
jgi:membrane-associated PAP2 superfamily phosphatase